MMDQLSRWWLLWDFRSYLSGMPELKLGLNDKLLFEVCGSLRVLHY